VRSTTELTMLPAFILLTLLPPAAADIVAALALSPPTRRQLTWPFNYLNMSVRGHPCLKFLIITDGCTDSDRLLREQLQARILLSPFIQVVLHRECSR
jgi:hypothetical protein